MGIPESREARYSMRGKPTTSHYRALKVAEQTLVVRRVTPTPPDPNKVRRISEEVLGRGWKPQRPEWLQELDRRPFQSRDQYLETLETDYVGLEKTSSAPVPSKSRERAIAFAELLAQFDEL
jgi:hypothetical protein